MAIPLQNLILKREKSRSVWRLHSAFLAKKTPKSDISNWVCWYYRGKTCNGVLHAQEINGEYFLVKELTRLLHLPDPDLINNYKFRYLLKKEAKKTDTDPQNLIADAKNEFTRIQGSFIMNDAAYGRVVLYQKKTMSYHIGLKKLIKSKFNTLTHKKKFL